MPCDTALKPKQTISQRKEEVLKVVKRLADQLVNGKVKPVISPNGAVTFAGLSNEDRDGVTDACAYRRLMVTGSALAKAKIAQAEQMAGRSINKKVIAHGEHSHDGGRTWHHGH